ncbi:MULTISPECIES: winged helix-turn-helix transcriptional regulator [Chryseobacterium]|jgi:DNA-binding HxlR family transcriptional regulator|uniref:winged helix-turn-helix transcriptional regulator n=1 Tax=Chryseobacterium TaxID=59732 RepID=UPI0009D83728|nr:MULTISPECIES: helix-turn-helix domain-containing protein [Chryseobacterium]MDR6547020.1 DNA-binding HxlR family transcriptional regulator [Chryseobacterium rhizosphaerae]SMC32971.1 transcriptional regulator, HxlR family [Chryseobacterium sp. YR221]
MNGKKETHKDCEAGMLYLQDTLEAIHGKWKTLVLFSIMNGNKRFKEIKNSIPKISGKVLAKELRDLEQNKLINRTVHDDLLMIIEYTPTQHTATLQSVFKSMIDWGKIHRKKIIEDW